MRTNKGTSDDLRRKHDQSLSCPIGFGQSQHGASTFGLHLSSLVLAGGKIVFSPKHEIHLINSYIRIFKKNIKFTIVLEVPLLLFYIPRQNIDLKNAFSILLINII